MLTCVIVDAYGPGMYFVPLLKNKGYSVIHIQSGNSIPVPFRDFIENAGFSDNLIYDNNLDEIVNFLKTNKTICVIPGFETGVMIADSISEALGTKSNGTALSAARRNKLLMMDALRSNNIPVVDCLKTNNIKPAVGWANTITNYPVVAKPVDSASSEDVYICHNDNELEIACNKIINKTNAMGLANCEALIQPFLVGTEYVVNSVSCDGRHYITDIWECKKRRVDNRIIYDREELLPASGQLQSILVAYIYQTLDALGIKYGAAHSEVMLTINGPVLIETGARPGGAVNPVIHQECIGHDQISLTVDAYTDPETFFKRAATPYKISKYLYVVMAISQNEGVITNITLADNLAEKLSGFRFMRLKKKIGDHLQKTVDLSSSPATIYLASENKDQLEAEYNTLLTLIDTGFTLE